MITTDDIVQITQLLNLFENLVDERDFSRHERVFTEDCELDYSYRGVPVIKGIKRIQEFGAKSMERDWPEKINNHMSNVYVYEDENGTVCANSKLFAVMAGGEVRSVDFHDELAKTPQGWRIRRRTTSTRDKTAHTWTRPSPSSA